jgi:hypothetical protein
MPTFDQAIYFCIFNCLDRPLSPAPTGKICGRWKFLHLESGKDFPVRRAMRGGRPTLREGAVIGPSPYRGSVGGAVSTAGHSSRPGLDRPAKRSLGKACPASCKNCQAGMARHGSAASIPPPASLQKARICAGKRNWPATCVLPADTGTGRGRYRDGSQTRGRRSCLAQRPPAGKQNGD